MVNLTPRAGLDRQYYRCDHVFDHLVGWLRGKGITANKPIHELRKEFGSLVNQKFGIYAASRALRHSDITTSTRHYIAKKERVTVGLGHLLAQPIAPKPVEDQPKKVAKTSKKFAAAPKDIAKETETRPPKKETTPPANKPSVVEEEALTEAEGTNGQDRA